MKMVLASKLSFKTSKQNKIKTNKTFVFSPRSVFVDEVKSNYTLN